MRLFLKDSIEYIAIYFISLLITEGYLFLLGNLSALEGIYILLFNSVILIIFLSCRYYRNREVYGVFNREIRTLDEYFIDLGNSVLGENITRLLRKENNIYQSEIINSNRLHNEHLTFINNWVHQMKTPLSVIKLQMGEYEGEEPIEIIKGEVDKLNKGLNMAMYYARIDSFNKDFVISKVNLKSLTLNKINEEKQLFIKSRIKPRIEMDDNLEVYSDEKWLRFIIEQLIVNGLKYSKDYGKELIISAKEEERSFKLVINDQGFGIPKKDIKRVFDPFFTGDNGRRFGESTGMGLYMAKKICDALGHRIYIDSIIENGTTVTIEFLK